MAFQTILAFIASTFFLSNSVQTDYPGLVSVVNSTLVFVNKVFSELQNITLDETLDLLIDNDAVNIEYWNHYLGNNKSIKINIDHEDEITKYWIPNLPLKVIIHGWHDSTDQKNGVFRIKTAYVNVRGYNVLTVDWRSVASNVNYMKPLFLTLKIGSRMAKVLKNIVKLGIVKPKQIHLIGHSLGAHIAGSCGSSFKSDNMTIGRITGLDPAGPGFEFIKMQKKRLEKTDALFVDAIHTAAGTVGFYFPLGHVDFYPNGGFPPQPGCLEDSKDNSTNLVFNICRCSHSRAYRLYEDSVYNRNSMIATKCSSWSNYLKKICSDSETMPMGHDASPDGQGVFYLKTRSVAPYSVTKHPKEDL